MTRKSSPISPRRSTSNPRGAEAPPTDPDRLARLTLAMVPGIGASRLAALHAAIGSATDILEAPPNRLRAVRAMNDAAATAVSTARCEATERLLARAALKGIAVLLPSDPGFPARLREIPDPPTMLWFRGNTALCHREAVAIVGSREHSRYGAEVARTIGEAASRAGLVVVSGMARGLDAVAHQAALDAGGTTIGVLGHGVDMVYPTVNRDLFDEVRARGLLLSEHPPGEGVGPGAFPRRNRLISGLARVLVVVEAAEGSGTMLTVTSALAQGREVLVVPGPINSPTSTGTNRLLRDGATPLLQVDDLLRLYGAQATAPPPMHDTPPCDLSPTEARVYDALTHDGRHVDELALAVGLPIGELLVTLLGLELGGVAEQLPGSLYRRRSR